MPIEDILKTLGKKYEENIVFILSNFKPQKIDSISTGSISIDINSGIGGFPRGRVSEIYGAESSGKSTICQHLIANAQKQNLVCAYIDTEQALDLGYASKCGIDISNLIISQPDSMETALNLTGDLIDSEEVGLIIFDSLVGIAPEQEQEKESGESTVSGIARLINPFFRKYVYKLRNTKIALVFTNQIRDLIGTYMGGLTTPGGHALKHYAAIRLQTQKGKEIKEDDEVVSVEFKATFKKNKVGVPYKTGFYEIFFDKGIWEPADVLRNAVEYGVISLRGSYYTFGGETIAQGKANTLQILDQNPNLMKEVKEKIKGE